MAAPASTHLTWDNTTNPYLGSGTAPPGNNQGLRPMGPLCSPTLPAVAPKGSFWLWRSGWINEAVDASASGGMAVDVFVPGGGPAPGLGNGDGPKPVYTGNVVPGQSHLGVGGLAPLPPGAQRHVTWPIPLPIGGSMRPELIDHSFQGGTCTFHIDGDQYVLSSDQQIVEVGASFPGTGIDEVVNLLEAANFGDTYVPTGYTLVPFAASVQVHTGSSRANRYSQLRSHLNGTPLADVNPNPPILPPASPNILNHPHRPNNNAIGLYVPPGTAPRPHTTWDPSKVPLQATDYPEWAFTGQEGDTLIATLIALLQPSTDPMPWTLAPNPTA